MGAIAVPTGLFGGGDGPFAEPALGCPWSGPGWLSSANAAITSPSFISSVGIQHQAPGLDPAWARIWFLDAAAHPVRSCRLVPVSFAQQRALELQVQYGAESLWML
jgi:hypothetical protein